MVIATAAASRTNATKLAIAILVTALLDFTKDMGPSSTDRAPAMSGTRRGKQRSSRGRALSMSKRMVPDSQRSVVLVADDDRVTRSMVSSWLSGAGYAVIA